VSKTTLVLSDSMLRGVRVGYADDTDQITRGGAVIRDLSTSIYYRDGQFGSRSIKVEGYRFIVIHVGTNDLSNGRLVSEVSLDIKDLIELIRQSNQDAVLLVSGVLYRPKDDRTTFRKVNGVNVAIKRVCDRYRSVLFLRSQSQFKSGSMLLTQLYDNGGLHLNQEGRARFGSYLRARLTRGCLRRDFEGSRE